MDTLQPSGTLNPGDRYVGNRYVMNLDQHPPAATADASSPWGGMSGAALFCGGLLAGVIASDPAGRAHASLEAVPAYVLMHDPAFRTALAAHAPEADSVLEPVEWQHLAEAADPVSTSLVGSPAALLRARRKVVPFRGRTSVIDDLTAWSTEAGFGALLLHGPGGQGKTRLAQHFADTLTAEGWSSLWLRPDTSLDALAVLSHATVPLLVVVDYAETRTAQLTALLEAAARQGVVSGSAFKLLLLARTPGDWWPALQAASPVSEELLDGADTIALPALEPEPGTSRTEGYREAVHGYAEHLPRVRGWQHHDWPAVAARLTVPMTDRPGAGAALDRPGMETALTLHMTALADLLDSAGQVPAATLIPTGSGTKVAGTRGVEDRLLVHERRYWTTTAAALGLHPALTLSTLTDALAAAFLLGAETRAQAEELLHRVPGLADQPGDRLGAVRGWISALYPAPSDGRPWDTLQPDRLAERFLGRHLQDHPELADHLVPGATDNQASQLLIVYARAAAHPVFDRRLDMDLTTLCTRHATVLAAPAIAVITQTEAPQPLLNALQQITDAPGTSLSDLEQLADRLPHTSHNLAPWAAHLAQLLVDHHRTRTHVPDNVPHLAASLNNLSIRLGDLGRREEALAAINEAVDVYRELAQQRPGASLPDLAMSLNNLAVDLGSLGRREEALAAINEAVDVYRELAQQRPEVFLPYLAAGLNNLSNRLGDLGRREEALAAINEAVDMYRELAQQRPGASLPDLAMSLHNLSNRLGDLGRREEALAAINEAIKIRLDLARQQPDAFLPDLAMSLSSLSVGLGDLGRWEEALAAINEAVDVYRGLAQQRPGAFLPDLAMSLNNLAGSLGSLGRWEEALAAINEAVDVHRELAQQRPGAFLHYLATSLNNLAGSLGSLGRWEEALDAINEAVKIRRELARLRPHVHQSELDQSLQLRSLLQEDMKDSPGPAG
ncbi:tetratricopeptide repeat protein [Streptomyces sp. NPDC056773]|uniref:tetratricopeptide repeat protein n=1 Tax=Streptomyces sp. NPDC056773 TaxID=3345941 RepID=UPI0036C0C0E1